MQLNEIMTPDVGVIHPDASVQGAAQRMNGLDIGPLPVCTGKQLEGMLTGRDITVRAVAEGRDPRASKADLIT